MFYVYMLRCGDGAHYTGLTNDLCRRMRAHASGKGGKYTRAFPPRTLEALWRCADETAARRLEYAIKKRLHRAQKEALIAAPDALGTYLPGLCAADYAPVAGVTLADCLEGRFHG